MSTTAEWQPPELASQEPPNLGPPVKRLWVRSRLLRWWLTATIVVDLITIAFTAMHLSLVNDGSAGRANETALAESDSRLGVMWILAVVGYGVTVILWLFWYFRAYKNIRGFASRKPRYGKWMAVFSWFIPIFNLFGPKQIANEIWRESDPKRRVSPLVHWWWALWVLTNVGGQVSSALWDRANDFRGERTASIVDLAVTLPIDIVAAVLAILVVRGITRRQDRIAAGLEQVALAEPEPAPALRPA